MEDDDDDDDDDATYVALIPRGLEHVVREMLQDEFQRWAKPKHPHGTTSTTTSILISTKLLGEEILECNRSSFVTNIRTKIQDDMIQRRTRRRRRGRHHRHDNNNDFETADMMIEKIHHRGCSTLVGTIEYTTTPMMMNQHVVISIGYNSDISNSQSSITTTTTTTSTGSTSSTTIGRNDNIWTTAGQMAGTIWMEIRIKNENHNNNNNKKNDRILPSQCCTIMNDLRYLGPIITLVTTYDFLLHPMQYLTDHQSVQDAAKNIQSMIHHDSLYTYKFNRAIQVWRDHVNECWDNLVVPDNHNHHNKHYRNRTSLSSTTPMTITEDTPIKYRISCIRNDSKKYTYTRRELLQYMDCIIPSSSSMYDKNKYTVDLTNYDLEIVLLYRPHCFVIGMSIRPYQYVTTSGRSFASGELPPDIAIPMIVSYPNGPRMVRLRTSTAQLLLHLAHLQYGDVVLDPCVGIGTIPIEAHIQQRTNPIFAIGGDLIMNEPTMKQIAVEYIRQVRNIKSPTTTKSVRTCPTTRSTNVNHHPVPDLLGWDATQLPIRSDSIDVIVSDLPFGQLCMSAVRLDTFIPLLIAELARVLRRSTGRMVLLCGSYIPIIKSLLYANEYSVKTNSNNELIWELPCTAVFPVNIGGNLAWIVQVRRSIGQVNPLPGQRDQVRKQVQKREHVEKMMRGTIAGTNKLTKMKHPQS